MVAGINKMLVNLNALDRRGAAFNPPVFERVKEAASHNRCDGRTSATLLIHPLFCQAYLSDPGRIFSNGWVQMEIVEHEADKNSEYRYAAYLKRLESHIKQSLAPIFVFSPPADRQNVDLWLAGLQFNAPVVMVASESKDATPIFGNGLSKKEAWQLFGTILDELDIKHLILAGEKAYREAGIGQGCVYITFHHLVGRFSPITVDQATTYPNLNVTHWSIK